MAIKKPAAALAILVALAGCGKPKIPTVQNEEPPASPHPLMSIVRMNDAAASKQLLSGFYPIESGSWRWTSGAFAVELKTPAGAAQRGATLRLAFSAPDPVIQKTGPLALTASIGGKELKSATYSTPGAYTFTADVPPELLSGDTVKADFKTDKTLPPTPGGDQRELALIATSASLATR